MDLHSRWKREGPHLFEIKKTGGRLRENLTLEEEKSLLEPFKKEGGEGGILDVKVIHEAYQKAIGKKIALSTTYRMLERHHWRKIMPRPRHPKGNLAAQEAFKKSGRRSLRERNRYAEQIGKPLKVFFQDEARFGRINDPRRCWAPKGIRPIVPKQMIREYTYVYGAICPFDGASCYLILPAMNKACMALFLEELSGRFPDYFLLVVYDGAPCHREGALHLPENIQVLFLPPYSPELNPSENGWDDMREKFFKNTVFNSIQAVEDRLVTACNFYESNPEILKSIAGWNWIVNSSLDR